MFLGLMLLRSEIEFFFIEIEQNFTFQLFYIHNLSILKIWKGRQITQKNIIMFNFLLYLSF